MDATQLKSTGLKFAGIAAALHALKAKRPFLWAAFLALHPAIKASLSALVLSGECSDTASNGISSILLYAASVDSVLPKDYVLVYIWMSYVIMWGSKKAKKLKEEQAQKIKGKADTILGCALKKYESLNLTSQTFNKLAFSAIFAQLISHYLSHGSNHNNKHLADFVRTKVFNPVWLHYSVVSRTHSLQWKAILKSYVKANLLLLAISAAFTYKGFKEKLDQKKNGIYLNLTERPTTYELVMKWLKGAAINARSIINLIYLPNILSMILFFYTLPIGSIVGSKEPTLQNYTKLIGFILSYIAVTFNYPVNPKIFGAINLYLFRLIVLSKWRITKETRLPLPYWHKLEAIAMSFGVFTFMNLKNKGVQETLVNVIGKIM